MTRIRHEPNLRKNLISLGMLDSQGCKFISSDEVLEDFKGVQIMLQGKKVGNLYRLVGGVLTRGTKVKHQPRSLDGVGEHSD